MPARASTYYHWSKDKPCTTNQDYGFLGKPDMLRRQAEDRLKTKKPEGPFDYARPFSNLGFFPDISAAKTAAVQRSKTAPSHKAKSLCASTPSFVNGYDMNRGYSMGHVPVPSRVVKRQYPADVRLVHHQNVPSTYVHPVPTHKDLYLWHTLSGCLVHVKNHLPEPTPDRYKRTREEIRALSAC